MHLNCSSNCSLQKVKIGPEYNDTGPTCVEIFLTLSSWLALLSFDSLLQVKHPDQNEIKPFRLSFVPLCPQIIPGTKFQYQVSGSLFSLDVATEDE